LLEDFSYAAMDIGSSSSMPIPSDVEIKEMDKLMSDGKRNYICNQPQLALDCFVELCEKLARFYGQESEQCVEAYLYYGKTLLDIARMENGVLGQAIPEGEEAEQKDVEESENDKEVEEEKGDGNNVPEEKDGENTVEADKSKEKDEVGLNGAVDCQNSDEEEDESDEVSNMELAWEMFELTSVICKRQLNEDGHNIKGVKSTLADAKHGLAQISLETERYDDAVTDFNECLSIYEEILEDKNDRLVAEAHYNIALALSFDKKYAESIKEFEKAVSILKARVSHFESKVKESEEKGGKEKAPVELEEWKKEINELNDLIVSDMMPKIEDAHESKKLLDESIKTVKNAASEMFSSLCGMKNGFDDGFDAPLTNTEVINDCSSKIRSVKRKNEELPELSEKKIKQTPSDESSSLENNL